MLMNVERKVGVPDTEGMESCSRFKTYDDGSHSGLLSLVVQGRKGTDWNKFLQEARLSLSKLEGEIISHVKEQTEGSK